MESIQQKLPLLVVVGPTASGKTSLSVHLAKELDGEVISADSMQMYRGMNIGTAKPSAEEMDGVPHHLIDILDVEETFSVADYTALARPIILEVGGRGKLPILTGGTGLYISAITDHIQFSPIPSDEALRESLRKKAEEEGPEAIHRILQQCDPESAAAIHPNNLGRVIRAVEVYRLTGVTLSEYNRRSREKPSPYRLCIIGLTCRDRQVLYDRIDRRVDRMIESGLLEEAKTILSQKNLSRTAAQAIGYKELRGWFLGTESLERSVERLKQESRNYAKRQLTWFRREKAARWLMIDDFADENALFAAAKKIAQEVLYGGGEEDGKQGKEAVE